MPYNGSMDADTRTRLTAEVERARRGLSGRVLARKVGLDPSVVFKLMRGDRVSASSLHKWALGIGESPDYWYSIGGYPELVRASAAPDSGAELYRRQAGGWAGMVSEAPERFDDEDAHLDGLYGCWGFDPPPPGPGRERAKRLVKAILGADMIDE